MDGRTKGAIQLLFYVSKFLGLIPFTFYYEKNSFKIEITIFSVTVCLIALSIITTPNFYSLYLLYIRLFKIYHDAPVNIFVRFLINILNLICHISTPLVLSKNVANLCFALNRLIQNSNLNYGVKSYLFYVILQMIVGLL